VTRFVDTAKDWIRPLQRGLLFPVQQWLLLERWQRTRRGAVVINYHGVVPRIEDPRMQPFCLTAAQFRDSLRVILETHEIVPLARLVQAVESGESPSARWAVITFDDGYVNTLTIARPILHELGDLPATVFVCPGLTEPGAWLPDTLIRLGVLFSPRERIELPSLGVDHELGPLRGRPQAYRLLIQRIRTIDYAERSEVARDLLSSLSESDRDSLFRRFESEQLMDCDQLRRVASEPSIEIGGHTTHHTILHAERSREVLDREIRLCREMLEQELDREVRHFAYPGGAHCPAATQAVRAAGYRAALTIRPGDIVSGVDPYLVSRLTVSPHPLVMRRSLARAGMNGGH
jgi:peptidoglycan/xylan/chitin deacetylase (PgdA/CDA1 family)